jgi:hypothetical protein
MYVYELADAGGDTLVETVDGEGRWSVTNGRFGTEYSGVAASLLFLPLSPREHTGRRFCWTQTRDESLFLVKTGVVTARQLQATGPEEG